MPPNTLHATNHASDALIVVDVQNAFITSPNAVHGHKNLIIAIEVLLGKARSASIPIIFLQNDGTKGALDEPFTPGWELYFTQQPQDIVMRKTKDDGFEGTQLDEVLSSASVQVVTICGIASEMCVAATARAAMNRGYEVLLPHDAHATYDIPPGPGSQSVCAVAAARVAEWSLGDGVRICESAHEVHFKGIAADSST